MRIVGCAGYGAMDGRNHTEGKYVSKVHESVVTTLYKVNGVEMRKTEAHKTIYTILVDGEEWSHVDNLSEAETLFVDFADISKAKLKKLAKLAG